jgi:Tfp pilus assembly protein FimT
LRALDFSVAQPVKPDPTARVVLGATEPGLAGSVFSWSLAMRRQRRAGFSAIELVVFLSAFVVLIAIAAPRLIGKFEQERGPASIVVVDSVSSPLAVGSSATVAVRVLSARGEPVRGHRVDFASSAAADSIAPAHVRTDTAGVAQAGWLMRGEPGARTLTASVRGSELEVRFSAEAVAADAPDSASEPPAAPPDDTSSM